VRGDLPSYDLRTPRDLTEALELVDPAHCYAPLAGGTDLMVLLSAGKLQQRRLVNLWPLSELRGIRVTAEAVTLGALTTYTEVQAEPLLQREFPMLCQAAAQTGGWAIQNRGTLGGNIANGSPAADSPPALLAYQARVELVSSRGARWVDYAAFHTGYKQSVLAPGEIISRVELPRLHQPGIQRLHYYRKVGPRLAQAISKVCLAACAEYRVGAVLGVRIAVNGVAPTVVLCPGAAQAALDPAQHGPAVAALGGEIAPIDDVRSTARYRRRVAQNLLADFLGQLRTAAEID
jgi:CO/xanthine dehydrogenase FAD-binding subunit